nr:hypothetical protein [uncultured Mucilaginibacter sp.]
MKVLKFESSMSRKLLIIFATDNKIAREDIITITCDGQGSLSEYTLFYYGEPEPEKEKKGFWG